MAKTVTIGRSQPGAADQDGGSARGRVVLGERAQIIVPVTGQTLDTVLGELAALADAPHDMIEWRVDYYAGDALADLPAIASSCDAPLLATVRTTAEGGHAQCTPSEYAQLVVGLAQHADAVDVEIERPGSPSIIAEAKASGAVVVASFHDFDGTPPLVRLREIVAAQAAAGADVLKFACAAKGPEDLQCILDVLDWSANTLRRPTIGIGMGEWGRATRTLGMTIGNAATFATVGKASAPGQLGAVEVRALLDEAEGHLARP